MLTKFACTVEYLGHNFAGFQRQTFDGLRTVQGELERAIGLVADCRIEIACAGRTDAGVNATGQVIHFETAANRTLHNWLMGINANLPNDISIREVLQVSPSFHARYSAITRRYIYAFYARPTQSSLLRHRASFIPLEQFKVLDIEAMQRASQYLIGENDFTSFRASKCQANTPHREIKWIKFHKLNEVIIMDICANAFLHHMVRNIMGTLLMIGKSEREEQWVHDVLIARNRSVAGATASADGLYLAEVKYAKPIFHTPFISPFEGVF